MRRTRLLIVLIIVLFSVPALPQQIPATSSIEGTVVLEDSGQPIANAQLTLVPSDVTRPDIGAIEVPGQIGPVTTGADGKFLFKDFKAGTYRLVATADGFVRQLYGQKVPFAQGRWLYFKDGQSLRDIVFQLRRSGTISGHVYDENGQPATGAPVQLLRPTFNAQGARSYAIAGNATVDDRGEFRIFGLTPGRYYLGAGVLSLAQFARSVTGMPSGPGLPPRFSTVYFPDSTVIDHASAVEVKGGEEASFDMHVKRQMKAIRVTGRVVDGTGEGIPAGLNIMLGWRTFNGSGSTVVARSIDASTGDFELQNIPPGEYLVQALVPPGAALGQSGVLNIQSRQVEVAVLPSASLPIQLLDSDIDGLVLRLSKGAVVKGRVAVDGSPLSAPPNLQSVRISLNGIGAGAQPIPNSFPVATAIAADGTFQVNAVREGEYPIQITGSGFYLKSIKYGEDEILGELWKYRGSSEKTLEIALGASPAAISGSVTDSKSQPVTGVSVVLLPTDKKGVERIRTAVTDQNGTYSLQNIAPGEYRAFSWESIEPNAYFDSEFLKQYEQFGKAISVTESSKSNVDVKLIPTQ